MWGDSKTLPCELSPKRHYLLVAGVQEIDIYSMYTFASCPPPLMSSLNLADVKFCSWEIQMVLNKLLLVLSFGEYV